MNLEDLRAVQVDERGTDSLQALPDSFYRDVAAYIDDLREERARAAERADNPFDSEDVRRLTDEVETAEEVVEAIYERRVGKVVKRASLAAAGMPADDEGLTDEERTLFNRLVDEIEANRQQVLTVFENGDSHVEFRGSGDDGEAGDDPTMEAGTAMGGDSAPESPSPGPDEQPVPDAEDEPTGDIGDPSDSDGEATDRVPGEEMTPDDAGSRDDPERVTLRITRDVGEVFGVDERVYELGQEDVVTLPEANAGPLLERDAAERLD